MASAKSPMPQSWNRYAYCFNNPLRYIDPDGRDVRVLDEQALQIIRNGLPKNIRNQVTLDKNGSIDKKSLNKIQSKDQNFLDLKAAVNNSQVIEVGTAKGVEGVGDFSYQSVEAQRKESIEAQVKAGFTPEEAAKNAEAINDPSIFSGYTLTSEQSPSGNVRVLISDGTGQAAGVPYVELVITGAHELYGHALPQIQGRPWKHDDGGPVDTQHRRIEDRTKRNYEGQQQRQINPRPKKPGS